MAFDNTKAVVESLLFVCDKPLLLDQISNVLDNLSASEIRKILEEMQVEYERENRGVRLIEIAGGFQLVTPVNLAPFLKKLYKQRHVERVSGPALETLAIIAYKQPVTKSEIELLRNVNVDGVVSSLLEKELIRVAGRKDSPGRPRVYGTTRQFLERFGLKSLEELPKIEEFSKIAQQVQQENKSETEPA
ncbi:MAG: SMC-Scp complex subunit ScpB, partial [Candidatus Omnitrophica bacterium]|nr:SMC-Scp complex subunit ScpB [Candidatus Omnitrophota bacterium]